MAKLKTKDKIFNYIDSYTEKHGYGPTITEIQEALDIKSSFTIRRHVREREVREWYDEQNSSPVLSRVSSPTEKLTISMQVQITVEYR